MICIVFFDGFQILVHIELVLLRFDRADCQIRAVVRDTFQVRAEIRKHEAQLDGAGSLAQTFDVPILDFRVERIDDFFQRFYAACQFHIQMDKGVRRHINDLPYRVHIDTDFFLCRFGKLYILAVHLFRGLADVLGVVGDPFQIPDAMQDQIEQTAIVLVQIFPFQSDDIGAQRVLIAVDLGLQRGYIFRGAVGIVSDHIHRPEHAVP